MEPARHGLAEGFRTSLVRDQPQATWNILAADEYGFHANVDPKADHTRRLQAREQRIRERSRRETLPFNGCSDQVAPLDAGTDRRRTS